MDGADLQHCLRLGVGGMAYRALRSSSSLFELVGRVGSDNWVWMIVDVTGDKGAVTIRTALQKKNDVWKITESSIGDQKIDLR